MAAFGLFPAMLATGLGSDVQRPLATVVVCGLASATALTLLLLPGLYYWLESRFEKSRFEKSRFKNRTPRNRTSPSPATRSPEASA